MEAPRRRWIPVTFLIWLGLFVLAAELNSDRPNMGDPRWSRQWWATYPAGEGMFYAWVLPALGIVWTLALLLRVPRDERIGRRRMFWAWMKAFVGMGIVLGTVGSYVSAFKAADVGSLGEIATWMSLAFFLVIASVALVKLRARRPGMTVRAAGLIGSAAALAIGLWFYWMDLPDDGVRGLKGSARAEALVARLGYKGSNEALRAVQEEHRTAGVGYKMLASEDRVDLEVAVPWPEADVQRRELIAEFWNHPSPVLSDIPKPPWHADWRTSPNDPQALVFSVRQPADRWEVYTLLMATSEAKGIAEEPWDDLRPLTSTLVDEHYSRANDPESWSTGITRNPAGHAAPPRHSTRSARTGVRRFVDSNGQQRFCVRDAPLHGGARAGISRCARQGQCAAVDAGSRELRGTRDRARKEQSMEHAARWVRSGSCN